MVQSMSLLALLTFIRNCSVVTVDDAGIKLTRSQLVLENGLTLIVLGICVIWLLLAAAYYVCFVAFKWSGNETGYLIRFDPYFFNNESTLRNLNFMVTFCQQ